MTLASYLVRPANIRFETQTQNEEIVLLLRKHPITQISWMVLVIIMLFLPFLLFPLTLELDILPYFISLKMLVFLLGCWYLFLFGFAFLQYLLWFFNVNIVTNRRIVDIDFPFLLYKETTATRLSEIEDVTARRSGFLRTIFNFGDVFVETAGPSTNLDFLDIPRPTEVIQEIVALWQVEKSGRTRFLNNKNNGED